MTTTSTATALPAETQRRVRGHRFYAPKADLKRVPALYATESTPLADKVVHLHYFTGGWDWYVVELDPATGRAFGLVRNPWHREGEWGYFLLPELEAIRPRGTFLAAHAAGGQDALVTLQWVVERDCWWDRKAVSAL